MVFYAEPKSIELTTSLKEIPDKESLRAAWFSLEELLEMQAAKKLRYNEPVLYAEYISQGGQITPISLMSDWIPSLPPSIEDHKHFKIVDGDLTTKL